MAVDKVLSSDRFRDVLSWAVEAAQKAIRESEMGMDLDMSGVGESRRKMLRMVIVKRGYLLRPAGGDRFELTRQKSARWVA